MDDTTQRESGLVLVTGGAGSVGRQLIDRLRGAGRPVRVFDLPVMDFSGLEDDPGIEIVKGDITRPDDVARAAVGVSAAAHLAALLPPNSERERGLTFAVNVDGTRNLIEALREHSPGATLVFTSSISTYGDTSAEQPPVTVEHSQQAIDLYAESKIAGEKLVAESALRAVSLRIAPIAVPAFLEPPQVWPFMPDQRVEMVHRDDVVDALFAAVTLTEGARGVLNVAGGASWQLTGRDYVNDFYDFVGAPADDAVYRESPGWVDWYDTEESQRILGYQNRPYEHYAQQMRDIVQAMMEE